MQRVGDTGTNISPEHEAYPSGSPDDGVDRLSHDRHDLVPLSFDHREHRVRLVGEAAGTDHAHGFGHQVADVLAESDRCRAESYKHDS